MTFLYDIFRISLALIFGKLLYTVCAEDLKTSKIKNKHILLGLKIIFTASALISIMAAFSIVTVANGWFLNYITHLSICAVTSFLIWKFKLWPAGDAKLFILCSGLIPLLLPTPAYFPFFLFVSILVNILVPAAIIFFIQAVWQFLNDLFNGRILNEIKNTKSIFLKILEFISITFIFVAFAYIRHLLRTVFHVDDNVFFVLLLMAWSKIFRLIKKNIAIYILCITGVIVYLWYLNPSKELLEVAWYSLSRSVPFLIFNYAILMLTNKASEFSLSPENLEYGVILTQKYLRNIEKNLPQFYKKHFDKTYPEGLTEEQALELKKILSSEGNEPEKQKLIPVKCLRGKPFALWIVIGTIITILINGETFVSLCRNLSYLILYYNR